jgi:hypothetical protein
MVRNYTSIPVPTSKQNAFDKDFDVLVEKLLKRFHVSGLSAAIVEGEKVTSKVDHILRIQILSNIFRDGAMHSFLQRQQLHRHSIISVA